MKSIVLLVLLSLLAISCGGSSGGGGSNSKKPVRTGEEITANSSRLAKALAGNKYCDYESEYDSDMGYTVRFDLEFYTDGTLDIIAFNEDTDSESYRYSVDWGASETALTIRIEFDGQVEVQTGSARVDTNGDLFVSGSGESARYYHCGANDSGSGTNTDIPTSDDDSSNQTTPPVVIPTIPSHTLSLEEVIKGNLFCSVADFNNQIYFANDLRYQESQVKDDFSADSILAGSWELKGNILEVNDGETTFQMTLEYTKEGILKVTRFTHTKEFEPCY